jgi:hypothetical protein
LGALIMVAISRAILGSPPLARRGITSQRTEQTLLSHV